MPGTELLLSPPAQAPRLAAAREELPRLAAEAAAYADAAKASSTRRAYHSSWRGFERWCDARGQNPLPASAELVTWWLTDRAPVTAIATLARHLAAIRDRHQAEGYAAPAGPYLDEVWSGIRHKHARPARQKRALTLADLRKVCAKLPAGPSGVRDKALLLLGFAAALRRSELVALEIEGGAKNSALCRCTFVAGGLHIRLGRSKTDQEGAGHTIAVPRGKTRLDPVAALSAWLDLSKIADGPIFREVDRHGRVGPARLSDRAVADIVKRAVVRAGLDPLLFSGHSLRAGFVTEAAQRGVATELIMRQTRHRKAETVAVYVREADLFRRNAAAQVGL
jgi:site-specific recombinase XerD